jgi:hypothetical protein
MVPRTRVRRSALRAAAPAGRGRSRAGLPTIVDDVFHAGPAAAIKERRRFTIELLSSDHEGGQRPSVTPRESRDDLDEWRCSVGPALEPGPAGPR